MSTNYRHAKRVDRYAIVLIAMMMLLSSCSMKSLFDYNGYLMSATLVDSKEKLNQAFSKGTHKVVLSEDATAESFINEDKISGDYLLVYKETEELKKTGRILQKFGMKKMTWIKISGDIAATEEFQMFGHKFKSDEVDWDLDSVNWLEDTGKVKGGELRVDGWIYEDTVEGGIARRSRYKVVSSGTLMNVCARAGANQVLPPKDGGKFYIKISPDGEKKTAQNIEDGIAMVAE